MRTPAYRRRWPASLAVILVLAAQLVLPEQVTVGAEWLVPGLEGLLLLPMLVTNPVHLRRDHPLLRMLALVTAVAVMVANASVLVRLVVTLGRGSAFSSLALIETGLILVFTNVVASAVLLWELDRGGPFARDPAHQRDEGRADLLFPQTSVDGPLDGWRPSFVDYLFVAFTLSTAFSPTDTMPLSGRTKVVFMVSAAVAMLTFALVAARAVNIL